MKDWEFDALVDETKPNGPPVPTLDDYARALHPPARDAWPRTRRWRGRDILMVACASLSLWMLTFGIVDQQLRLRIRQTTAIPPVANPIDSVRRTDWSDAGVHILGQSKGIPHRTTQCVTAACNTLAGGTVTATTIQNAVATAPADTFVRIPSGTFSIGGINLNRNDVTLRGDGTLLTKLVFTGGVNICGDFRDKAIAICSDNNYGTTIGGYSGPQNTATWSSGYAKGTTTIVISSTTNLIVGSTIFLDQLTDTSEFPATGDLFECEGGPPCSSDGGGGLYRNGRVHTEVHQVTACGTSTVGAACSSTTLTIDPPIHSPDYRSGQTPGAWWGNATGGTRSVTQNFGIEDLTVDYTSGGTGETGLFAVNCTNCWVKNTRWIRTGPTPGSYVFPILPMQTFRFETRDSYIYGTDQVSGTPLLNYTYAPHVTGSGLLENTIFHSPITPIAQNGSEVGDVIGYNYVDAAQAQDGMQLHGHAGDMYNLNEGNDYGDMYCDDNHGPHYFWTMFRNYVNRDEHNNGGVSSWTAINLLHKCRFWNVIGNVISNTSYTVYGSTSGANNAIFSLGWVGNCSNCGGLSADTNVSRTLFRWGNWDNVTSTTDTSTNNLDGIRWCGNSSNSRWTQVAGCNSTSEVPTGITNYPQTVPSTETLPSSLYLSARPTWWSASIPFPAIGPDVTSGNISSTGGHANKIPARVCFESLASSLDTSYPTSSPRVRNFDGAVCYP